MTTRPTGPVRRQLVDLTRELGDGDQPHRAHPPVRLVDVETHAATAPRFEPPCLGWASKLITVSDHAGTHVDAPVHFHPDGPTVENLGLDRCVGPALVLDLGAGAASRAVTAADLSVAEARSGEPVTDEHILLLRARGASPTGLAASAVAWILERRPRAVGSNLASIDCSEDLTRPAHVGLLAAGIPIFDDLVNLEDIPTARCTFIGLPLRLRGATGSPVRAVAILEETP